MRPICSALAVLAVLGTITACDDGEVRFGPPNGLRIRGDNEPVCDPPELMPTPAECATVGWAGPQGVFAKYMDVATPGRCSAGGCHLAGSDDTGVNMVPEDALASYDALAAFPPGDGAPYISTNPDDNPYLLCNINPNAPRVVGSLMPKGLAYTQEALDEITLWVACGMGNNEPGMPMGTGGMGMGGMGMGGMGMGGAGGANQ